MKSYSSINENDGEIQELLIEEAFLRSMSGEISKAIKDYHGEIRLYFLPKITMVTKNEAEDNFDVTVQVVTYLRAIMPPYGIETITFRIPGYKVLKFEHKEIRGEDLPKDKFDSKSKIKKW
ncbi:DUF3888 domain-containing protein [Viridibacillus sp. YIM B01967]|uniref:DUF3888 domain-containing protein n=2 Tax=Viridibacillus soli TaxID=2798301 RepID=A0ABS1HC29_9BACL|nr:DUF3888 domain-containing protein [Viridibacillus soli]